MYSQWQEFLLTQGAVADSVHCFVSFSNHESQQYPDNSSTLRLFALGHLPIMAVSGKDAVQFLQGQFTNDLRQLTMQHSQLGCHCAPNGRVVASSRLIRQGESIYLQVPIDNLPNLLQRLTKYKLRAQVQLEDASTRLLSLGVSGNGARQLLQHSLSTLKDCNIADCHDDANDYMLPQQPDAACYYAPFSVVNLSAGGVDRLMVIGPEQAMPELWVSLVKQGAIPTATKAWVLLDIAAGIPWVHQVTVDAFLPQMLNLQLLGGVSFKKGCYTGQEVVARLQHLGTLKRRLFRAEVAATACPQPGELLYSEVSASPQGAGMVVESSLREQGVYELLVVVEIAAVQSEAVKLGSPNGPTLVFLPLPYAVTDPIE